MSKKDAFRVYLKMNQSTFKPFTVYMSNYTKKIDGPYPYKDITTFQSNRVFAAYAMICRDLAELKNPPDFSNNSPRYYNNNLPNGRNKFKKVFNIDLNKAYATILKNEGLIKKETFNYLLTLSKMDRLAAVGMLAGRKDVYKCVGPDVLMMDEIKKETRDVFFWVVSRCDEILSECARLCWGPFMFSWVDGIYFTESAVLGPVYEYLDNTGFEYKTEILTDFEITEKADYHFLTYLKNDGEKRKYFFIPKPDNQWKKRLFENNI